MRRTIVYLGIAALLVAGCGKESREEIAGNLKDKDAMDVLQDAGEDEYEPPADGRLTEDQVEMYLKVREREVEIAKVARQELEDRAEKVKEKGEKSLSGLMEAYKGLGSAADFVTADIRAAQELGYNTAEYSWVKERVIKASATEYMEKSKAQLSAATDQIYQSLKKQYDEATDETTKQNLKQALDQMEQGRAEMADQAEQVDDADKYNRELLSKYEDTLKALVIEASKWRDDDKAADEMTEEMREGLEASTSTQEP